MTVNVLLTTLNPENNVKQTLVCEFNHVPIVGEYIWLLDEEGNNSSEIQFKVVYVAHLTYNPQIKKSKSENKVNARIYAVKEPYEVPIQFR